MERPSLGRSIASWLLSLLILASAAGAFAFLVYKPKQKLEAAPRSLPPLVQTREVAVHTGILDMDVDGVVVPFREVTVAAEVAGRVSKKTDDCRAGRVVTRGTALLEIDRRDYDLDLQRLTSQLDQAQASLSELYMESSNTETLIKLAEEDVTLNRSELDRVQKLSPRAVAEASVDQAKRAELASRNVLQTLRNQLQLLKTKQIRLDSTRQLAQIELQKAELDLSRTRIVSPLNGVVVRESVEEDSFVQKGAPLVTIEDTSAVEVRCNLKMEQVAWLWRQASAAELSASSEGGYQIPPTPVTVTYDLGGQLHSWAGVLARYEGIGLDEKTRTVPCRVLVPNPRGQTPSDQAAQQSAAGRTSQLFLVRGMYVTVHLHLAPNVSLVRVSEEAVHPGKTVWVVRDNKLSIVRDVKLVEIVPGAAVAGIVTRDWLIEPDGEKLKAGDRVVVTPLSFASDGLEVREQQL